MENRFISLSIGLVFGLGCLQSRAETLGPSPYLSEADSPFAASLSLTTFWLEDFEDGELNAPGVSSTGLEAGVVKEPSPTTSSVDADDGVIDGSGVAGRSFANQLTVGGAGDVTGVIAFDFSAVEGALPTSFGLALTDGPPLGTYIVTADLVGGGQFAEIFSDIQFSVPTPETTADDRFIGFRSATPFTRVVLTARSGGPVVAPNFEIDHLQYGAEIPEPGAALLAACTLLAWRRRQRL